MGTISIDHIILNGNQDDTLDLTGVSTCLELDKSDGNLIVIVTGDVCLRGTVNGALTLQGNGNVTLCGVLERQQFLLDGFTGTFDNNGWWQILSGGMVVWVFATHSKMIEKITITEGGIR